MTYIHKSLIVAAAQVDLARSLCAQLAGPAGEGMFVTPLSPAGDGPATHFISAGMIDDTFAAALSDPAYLFSACQQAGIGVTFEQCVALLDSADVSSDAPFEAMSRLGVSLFQVQHSLEGTDA